MEHEKYLTHNKKQNNNNKSIIPDGFNDDKKKLFFINETQLPFISENHWLKWNCANFPFSLIINNHKTGMKLAWFSKINYRNFRTIELQNGTGLIVAILWMYTQSIKNRRDLMNLAKWACISKSDIAGITAQELYQKKIFWWLAFAVV